MTDKPDVEILRGADGSVVGAVGWTPAGAKALIEHEHVPEKRPYQDQGGGAVYMCGICGARVRADGRDWQPGPNYPWGRENDG